MIYRYTHDHNGKAVKELLGDFSGRILADAHIVYDQLYIDSGGTNIECGCWAHARRYMYEAQRTDPERALLAIGLIGQLFMIERAIEDLDPVSKRQTRQERSKPIVDKYFDWCNEQLNFVLDDTPIQKAINYSVNQKIALSQFLDDGNLPMHNNFSELQLRHQKIGSKNWLFIGSENGAEWNCTFTSLIASCHLHQIEPWAYLRDLFILCAPMAP